jgi:hypothetical protein
MGNSNKNHELMMKVLLEQVTCAQQEGKTCYLLLKNGASVKIDPDGNPADSFYEAVQFNNGQYENIEFGLKPQGGLILQGNICDNNNNNLGALIDRMYEEHPPETITTPQELTALINQYLPEPVWFAYTAFFERLPTYIPKAQAISVVVPFLEAGEISRFVCEAAEKFLQDAGYTAEKITKMYSKQERERRQALGDFISYTGIDPTKQPITTLEALHDAVSRQTAGAKWHTYCQYIKSLPQDTPEETITKIIIPLLEAGELAFAGEEAEKFLQSRGYTPEAISKLYSKQEKERRRALSHFKDSTGIDPTKQPINTLEELDKIISAKVEGIEWVAYYNYLIALPKDTPRETLENIVIPLLNRESDHIIRRQCYDVLERTGYKR